MELEIDLDNVPPLKSETFNFCTRVVALELDLLAHHFHENVRLLH